MDRGKSTMLYVFGGAMDGLIVRAQIANDMPYVNTIGTVHSREYGIRELICLDGMTVRAFVHKSLTDEEAATRYHAVTRRSKALRETD